MRGLRSINMSKNTTNKITPLKLQAGVWETDLKQGPKIVLLALIDHLNFKRDDWRVWPSTEKLASMCGMHRNPITGHLRTLAAANLIKTTTVSTKNGTRYDHEVAVETLMRYATNRGIPKEGDALNQCHPMQRISDTPSTESVHEVAKGNSKGEVQTPVAAPQGGKTQTIGKQEAGKIYSAYEVVAENYQTTKVVLTAKEKKQLKDVAQHFKDCNVDPVAVIDKVVRQWDRFKRSARLARGWSNSFKGGGLSPNPTVNALVTFQSEAVQFYQEDEIAAQRDAEDRKAAAERNAAQELDAARRKEVVEREDAIRESVLRADPDYRRLTDAIEAHAAKKSQPDFGMTEDDCWFTWPDFGDGNGETTHKMTPEKAWNDIEIELTEELQKVKAKLKDAVDQALFVEGAVTANLQALANNPVQVLANEVAA